jgi:hypothetical protein
MRDPAVISREINDLDDRLWLSNCEVEIAELRAKLKILNDEYDAAVSRLLLIAQEKTL